MISKSSRPTVSENQHNRRTPTSSYFAPALEKGLDILEALSQATVPQTLADLARACERTPSQIFRMVDALERRFYIVRDPVSGGYELTLKVYRLAHTRSPVDQLLRAAQVPMRNLAKTIRESCHLCVINDYELLVIAEESAPTPVRLSVEVGYHASLCDTTSGKVLIAFMDPDKQAQTIEQDPIFGEWKTPKRKLFYSQLAQIRKQGFLIAEASGRSGFDVSCFVGSARLEPHAVLAVPFIPGGQNSGREHKLIPLIQDCARCITEVLGYDANR